MLRRKMPLILFLFIAASAFLCTTFGYQAVKTVFATGSREARWERDIDYLVKELPKRHVNLFFNIAEEDFKYKAEKLKQALPGMNDDEIRIGIKKLLAAVGDTHTDCYIETTKIYPLALYWLMDGIYATDTVEKYRPLIYKKLSKVNGEAIGKVIESLTEIIPHENEAQLKLVIPRYIVLPEIMHGLGIVPDTDKSVFTFEDVGGEEFDVEMEAVLKNEEIHAVSEEKEDGDKPLYLRKTDECYWYSYIDEDRMLYFKYNKCCLSKLGPLDDILEEILGYIDEGKVGKLVVDMRDNGGGCSSLLDPFIDEIGKRDINARDRLFVIVGRGTFSSAILNALHFKNETNATFLGEPTGGKPNHYGEIKYFKLPYSGMQITYSTKYFSYSKTDSPSFMPDENIEVTLQDLKEGRDPVLEAIIRQ